MQRLIPSYGIKFHLQIKLPQAICFHNTVPTAAAVPMYFFAPARDDEDAMPDIKVVTEVAGRVCALPIEIGTSVGSGDQIAFVEAMKMEIPVEAPAAGKLKSLLVALDEVVSEGQALAILET
jgi:biotin carboxyl carrier protein